MPRTLDKKEVYLYGTLLALVYDNLVALERYRKGELGLWGRARASSRNGTIDKFVKKLFAYKDAQGHDDPAAETVADLTFIGRNHEVWDDISVEQLDFAKKLIAG